MNRRGSVMLGIVIGIIIFMLGILMVNFIKPEIDTARGSTGLDCTNSTITDGTKLSCLVVDVVIPYFIIVLVSAAGGIIAARFLI